MKIFYFNYKTMYKIAIFLGIILTALSFFTIKVKNKSQNTFSPEDVFYKGNKEVNTIAFACNIDWGNEFIPEIINIFKEENILITFFPTGNWSEKNEDLLKLIANSEHEIGNHGYSHKDYDKLNFVENKEEILKADKIIKNITGISPRFFAPPSGAFNEDTIKAAKESNYDLIMRSIDTIDWRDDSTKEKIIERVVSKAENSGIVLMHPTKQTVEALPTIIQKLKQEGYEIGRITDVMK